MKTNSQKNKGFTLIELLVVIVILGILGTIGFANFRGYFARAQDAEKKAIVQALASALKVDGATEFTNTKYDITDDVDFQIMLGRADYRVPTRIGGCVYFGFSDGTNDKTGSDNQFLFLIGLSEEGDKGPEGDLRYGYMDGSGADALTTLKTAGNFTVSATYENMRTCNATTTDLNTAASAAPPGGGWGWTKVDLGDGTMKAL
ncbi:MAG TPA: type II secretion system protein [Candidatus Gracilibacteria bacterium]